MSDLTLSEIEDAETMSWTAMEQVNRLEAAFLLGDRNAFNVALEIVIGLIRHLIAEAFDVTRELAAYLAGTDAAYAC